MAWWSVRCSHHLFHAQEGMQALTELLQLPHPVAAFITQQLAGSAQHRAIAESGPGHCLWQLRKLLADNFPAALGDLPVPAPPAPVDSFACAPAPHHVAS